MCNNNHILISSDLLSPLFTSIFLNVGIYIECQGKSKVHWDKWMLRDNSRTYYECYRAEESYFKKELCIFGDGELRFSSPYIVHI